MSAPGTCPDCGAAMRPLLVGSFCPNDCDRRERETPARWSAVTVSTPAGSFRGRQMLGGSRPGVAFDRASLHIAGHGMICPMCGNHLRTTEPGVEVSVGTCNGPDSHRVRIYEGPP